jgi:hypothetical protein
VHQQVGDVQPALTEHLGVEPANNLLVLLTARRDDIILWQHVLLLWNRKWM